MNTNKLKSALARLPRGEGFTLLYAIIMVAAVLFITTSALFLLTRQVRFATISNDSQDAYYAAESAGECILSYAQAGVFDKGIVQDIVCDGVTYRTDGSPKQTFKIKITNPTTGLETVAIVTVDTVKKTIDSLGYNSDDETLPTRLQRAITFRYKSYCPIGGDVMILADTSGSIDASELVIYKKSIKYLIDRIYAAEPTTNVGLIEFNTNAQVRDNMKALNAGTYLADLKADVDLLGEYSGRTHTSIALRSAWLQFQDLKDSSSNSYDPTGIFNSDSPPAEMSGGMIEGADIVPINPPVNRDDEEYSNHVILFTDGGPNDWISTSSVRISGVLKPKGFYIDSPCKWNADGSVYADSNDTAPGCYKGAFTIPAQYSFMKEATNLKTLATLYTVAIGLGTDPDGAGSDECLPGVTCLQQMQEAATTPDLSWVANDFNEARLNQIADEILACNIPIKNGNTAPIVLGGYPTGSLPQGTTQTTMSVTTNEDAQCKWSTGDVSYGAMANTFTTTGTKSHSTTLTGLTNNTSYTRYIRCQDSGGLESTPGYIISFSVAAGSSDTTVPSVPAGLTANPISSTQINLSWTASTDNVAVTGYELQRCAGASCTNFTSLSTPTGTTYNNTGLTAGTTYRYKVRARDAASNWSAYSSIVDGATSAGAVSIPTGYLAYFPFNEGSGATAANAAGSGNASLLGTYSWVTRGSGNAIDFNGASGRASVGDVTFLDGLSKATFATWMNWDSKSTNSSQSIMRKDGTITLMQSNNSTSLWRSTIWAPTSVAHAVPLSNIPTGTWTHVAVVWDNSVNSGKPKLYVNGAFVMDYPTGSTGVTANSSNALMFGATESNTEWYDGKLDDVIIYGRALTATEVNNLYNATQTSAPSADTTAPTAPTGLRLLDDSATTVAVDWNASTDAVGVTGYEVQRCTGASCTSWVTVESPTATDHESTGLSAGTVYRFRVRARDAAGNWSAYSSIVDTQTIPTSGLIGQWLMDSQTGGVVSSNQGSGSYGGTLTGGAAINTSAPAHGAGAVLLDGVNDIVNFGDITEINGAPDLSVSLWFKDANAGSTAVRGLFTKFQDQNTDFLAAVDNANFYIDLGNGSADTYAKWNFGAGNLAGNTWHHAVIVYDGTLAAASRLKLYVDNVQRTLTFFGTIPATINSGLSGNPFRLGTLDGSSKYWNGRIDSLRIYNRDLTANEVDALYNQKQ